MLWLVKIYKQLQEIIELRFKTTNLGGLLF